MPREPESLKLGKGAAFVKSQLRYLPQEDDTWEADFLSLSCSGAQDDGTCMGMVISHAHQYLLAQRTGEEPPTVNDLADLLAQAMQRPMTGIGHRPQSLYLRARPEWAELLPHLKQIGIHTISQEALLKSDLRGSVCQGGSGTVGTKGGMEEGTTSPGNQQRSQMNAPCGRRKR